MTNDYLVCASANVDRDSGMCQVTYRAICFFPHNDDDGDINDDANDDDDDDDDNNDLSWRSAPLSLTDK